MIRCAIDRLIQVFSTDRTSHKIVGQKKDNWTKQWQGKTNMARVTVNILDALIALVKSPNNAFHV